MKDRKSLLKKFLCPPAWLIVLLVLISIVSIIVVFTRGFDTSPIAYAVYVVAFYLLTVVCIVCARVFPHWYRKLKRKIYGNTYGNRYMTDVAFKTHVSLYRSLAINMLYAGANSVSGLWYRSAWFAILAAYYAILAVMRFLLLRFVGKIGIGKDPISEFQRSRLCGVILITINLTLSGAVLMMLYQDRGYEYCGMLIYVMALYTFYVTTHAIVSIIKYRKYNSPVLSASKVISLSAALVSMLSLETAMFSQFGADSSPPLRRLMIAVTGAGVSIVVVSMSVYMIIRATKEIQKLRIMNSQT